MTLVGRAPVRKASPTGNQAEAGTGRASCPLAHFDHPSLLAHRPGRPPAILLCRVLLERKQDSPA